MEEEKKILHDISNQLMVIQGMSGFILKSIRGGKVETCEKQIEKIANAVESMANIIRRRRNDLESKRSFLI